VAEKPKLPERGKRKRVPGDTAKTLPSRKKANSQRKNIWREGGKEITAQHGGLLRKGDGHWLKKRSGPDPRGRNRREKGAVGDQLLRLQVPEAKAVLQNCPLNKKRRDAQKKKTSSQSGANVKVSSAVTP